MEDTAQPVAAAETDPIADAAEAFKVHLGQAEPKELPPRDDHGRFARAEGDEPEEIDAEDETPVESEAESHDEEETDEAAEEAQPEAVDLPTSWPAELAEEWQTLPAKLQDTIVRREAERDTAVNAKFQEAANLRKAHEAEINEAKTNRQHFAEAADFVLSLARPQKPPITMLDPTSGDYNPDAYHLAHARYEETNQLLTGLQQQRQSLAQQEAEEEAAKAEAFRSGIEEKYGPLLLKDVPDIAHPEKQAAVISEIAHYAVENGVPAEVFTDPERAKTITSADLRIAWKAMQYDKMIAAKAKVTPKAAKPSAPVVKPGVATPRSAIEQTRRRTAFDRLDRSGSIEDGAAAIKHLFKGK